MTVKSPFFEKLWDICEKNEKTVILRLTFYFLRYIV